MHLILRSSQARGVWSFARPKNRHLVEGILARQASRSNVELLGVGNSGNHLHLRVRFSTRAQYMRFIRAVCGEIALKIKRIRGQFARDQFGSKVASVHRNFWDKRPFSSIVSGLKYAARLADYIKINQLEGFGYTRAYARLVVRAWKNST